MQKTFFLFFLSVILAACSGGPSLVKSGQATRPYTVNFLFQKAQIPELTAEAENRPEGEPHSKTVAVLTAEDEVLLKNSALGSIEAGKLFEKMNFSGNLEELSQTEADYSVVMTYSGGVLITRSGLNRGLEVKILMDLEVFKGKESVKKIKVTTRQQSVWTEARAKSDCIENAVKGILDFIEQEIR